MSYRITEAARNHVAVIEDIIFKFIINEHDKSQIELLYTDGDKLNEKIAMPKYSLFYDKAGNFLKIVGRMIDPATGELVESSGLEVQPGWEYSIEGVYDPTKEYLTGIKVVNENKMADNVQYPDYEPTILDITKLDKLDIKSLFSIYGLKVQDPKTIMNKTPNATYSLKFDTDENGNIKEIGNYHLYWDEENAMYRVVFYPENGEAVQVQAVAKYGTVFKPTEPERYGFNFLDWWTTKDSVDGIKWDFDSQVTSNIELFARWETITYMIKYIFNFANVPAAYLPLLEKFITIFKSKYEKEVAGGINMGELHPDINQLDDLTSEEIAQLKDQFVFGWFYDADHYYEMSFNGEVDENITVYAKAHANMKVTLDIDGEEEIIRVLYGEKLDLSKYEFEEWILDDVNFDWLNTPITENITLKAVTAKHENFWWGNFIPNTIVQPTDLSASPIFNVEELIDTVNNARKRITLSSGNPPTHTNAIIHQGDDDDNSKWDIYNNAGVLQQTGTTKTMTAVRWEEIKYFEEIEKNKNAVTLSGLGYLYFVSPTQVKEVINAGVNAIANFNETEIIIEDIKYYLYYFLAAAGGTLELGLTY